MSIWRNRSSKAKQILMIFISIQALQKEAKRDLSPEAISSGPKGPVHFWAGLTGIKLVTFSAAFRRVDRISKSCPCWSS